MSEHESSSLVVIDQEQPLADSREIARELGIDHESFSTMIKRYQQEIEADFGRLRCEIGVKVGPQRGNLPRYALLTEDQTSAYLSYSQNTPQARACKRLLVKAFGDARVQLQVASAAQPKIKSLWERRLDTFRLTTKIPEGYWCIFEIFHAPDPQVSLCLPGPARRPARQHLSQRLVRRVLDVVSRLHPQRALPGLPPGAHDLYDYNHCGTASTAHEQERKRGKTA